MVARVPSGAQPRHGRAKLLPWEWSLVAPQIRQNRIGPLVNVRWPLPIPWAGAEATATGFGVARERMARFLSCAILALRAARAIRLRRMILARIAVGNCHILKYI